VVDDISLFKNICDPCSSVGVCCVRFANQKKILEAGQAGSASGYFCVHGILHRLFCAIEIIYPFVASRIENLFKSDASVSVILQDEF
jgi:hypothetical protein